MRPISNISPIWLAAAAALALASLGLERERPMVADLELPRTPASD